MLSPYLELYLKHDDVLHTHTKKEKAFLNDSLEHKRSFLHVGWVVDCVSASVCDGCCVVETCRALFSLWAGSFDALPLLSHAWQG